MSDSSSDEGQGFTIEDVPEDSREHVREVLAKGRQITPFYNVPPEWTLGLGALRHLQALLPSRQRFLQRTPHHRQEEGGVLQGRAG